MKQHVRPSLLAKYEREMAKLRGIESNREHIVENIKKLNEEEEKIESDEERRARDLAEDAAMEEFLKKQKESPNGQ